VAASRASASQSRFDQLDINILYECIISGDEAGAIAFLKRSMLSDLLFYRIPKELCNA
jgi:hypothetical protein